MLASPEAPPASAGVTSDHRFPAAALIEQQYLTNANAGPRRTSYSLYHHNTHEPEVYSEFNWESHSKVKLCNSVEPPRDTSESMEKKLQSSPGASAAFEAHCGHGEASPSPSLSLSDAVNSDGVNGNNDTRAMSLATSHDPQTKEKDSLHLQPSNKRPRPPSLSRLDDRAYDRCPYSPASTDGLSKQLQTSSELASFTVGEYAPHQNPVQGPLTTPHSATSISFASHQSDSQSLTFPSHSNRYLSALPSPVVTQSNEQAQSDHRASYPASPLMTLSAPNSATFPPNHSSSGFNPLSPQLDSTRNQSNLVSSSPPPFQNSAAPFSHTTTHFTAPPYHNNGTAEKMVHPVSSSVPSPVTCVTIPPSNTSTASPWSSVENQAPRRRGKLPSAVTGILRTWLMSHTAHPYPTEEEKKSLCEQTSLTMNQVSNWFINARRRILVPPSAGNSVHEVRQPVRRQALSQLAQAASNASLAPPCLTIRHVSPQSMPASPSTGLTIFSPVSASSPNLSNGGSFDFRYPLPHQSVHENSFHGGNLNGCRPVNALCSSPNPWPHTPTLIRQPPSSPLYPPHGSHALTYYSSSQSAYLSYHTSNPSASSTPLPSPIYSFPPYSTNQARLNSPRPHSATHPPPSTLSHSGDHHQTASTDYITQACNQSTNHSPTPDREE